MRIQFQMEGGIAAFPGLSKPVTIKTEALSVEDTTHLQRLVVTANFFELPAKIGQPPPGAADYRTYTITIEEGERRRTVSIIDPIEDENLATLVEFLQAKARASK